MKKFCITFLIFLILVVSIIGLTLPNEQTKPEYLRVHIRANSNLDIDQQVKYKVKDKVVLYLTPILAECDTKEKAERAIINAEKEIENIADGVLKENGFSYLSNATVKTELFPTRVYDGFTLEAGYYDALIINLGSGEGDNWWCVVYPPLCFTGEGSGYIYKSKIYDIIDKFFQNIEREE